MLFLVSPKMVFISSLASLSENVAVTSCNFQSNLYSRLHLHVAILSESAMYVRTYKCIQELLSTKL